MGVSLEMSVMTKELAIVIPLATVKSGSNLVIDECLQSIVNGGTADHAEVILCWDGVPERTVDEFERRFPQFISLPNYGNRLNFSKNSNRGMRLAHKEMNLPVLLCNQDCVLPHWELIQALTIPLGLVTPTAVQAFPESLDVFETTFTKTQGKFSFHCPYFPIDLMSEIGYNDEGLVVFGDDDYIIRTLLAGFDCHISNIPVVHKGSFIDQAAEGSSMSGAYDLERLGIDHQRFRWKWSIPPDVGHENFNEYILMAFKWNPDLMYIK